MAGIAHAGVGMAAKRLSPKLPLWILIVAAYVIDIIWGIFFVAGLEKFAGNGTATPSPFSHGLLMAVVWSVLSGVVVLLVARHRRTAVLIGLLVFSHWIVDFIAKPMLAAFPSDTGLPLLFRGSPLVGLGLYRTRLGLNLGEYGTLPAGAFVYLTVVLKNRKHKKNAGSRVQGVQEGM